MRIKRKASTFLIITTLLTIIGIVIGGCASFGTLPSESAVDGFKHSSHYDPERQIFVNRRPGIIEEMRARTTTFSLLMQFLFGGSPERSPSTKLPEVKPDLAEFQRPADDIKLIWFGHSSVLLNLEGRMVLVDPVLSTSTGPMGFMMKRFQDPVVKLSELPPIDVILISHDHYDHLDTDSIRFFKESKTRFIVPLGVGSHLVGWGISPDRITELDWWQNVEHNGLHITLTPAQHFSGRDFSNQNKTLWGSFVVRSAKHKIFFSGDTGYDTHFKEIGDRLGPFDLAFIESGQYNEKWREVHMLPDESLQAFKDLKAKRYFPIHWGMFNLSLHAWHEPVERITAGARRDGITLVTPRIGEAVQLNDRYVAESWWRPLLLAAKATKAPTGTEATIE
ncbi:MAG: hydrolase [Spirochaetae bacterium HGW-Spirochaetae-10]|nr:MAG: hydrolase [Spirochaetae bacterium HGW-Spirochaetae-10]